MKIVNFLGFKGVREVAFTELNALVYELPGIYSLIGEIVFTFYWLYIEMHGCLGPANIAEITKLTNERMGKYPNVRKKATRVFVKS